MSSTFCVNPWQSTRRKRALEKISETSDAFVYRDIHEFKETYSGKGQVGSIDFHGNPIDFLLRPSDVPRLVVTFNSQQSSDGTLKLFTWMNLARQFNSSVLHISDPTLYVTEDSLIGWYASNYRHSFQADIQLLIQTVMELVKAEEVVFLGSSGGGFPAALYSQIFPGSTALLLAPTLNLREATNRNTKQAFLTDLNRVSDFSELDNLYPEQVLSIKDLVEGVGEFTGSINLLQSRGDLQFWKHHTMPLLSFMEDQPSTPPHEVQIKNFSAVFGDWSDGHAPPPNEVITRAVDFLSQAPIGEMHLQRLTKDVLEQC